MDWTPEVIAEQYEVATPLMRQIQQHLAARPGQWITAATLAEATGSTRQGIAGAMGAYSSYVYRRWGSGEWPFEVRRYKPRGETSYRMPERVATVVAALRS